MKHKLKIDLFSFGKMYATIEAIGQLQDVHMRPIQTSEIQGFFGVSKPTAIKYLNIMQSSGYLTLTHRHWRGDAMVYMWDLTEKARALREKGICKREFDFYRALIIQVSSTRGKGTMSI